MIVLIPTHKRVMLLERTLASMAQCPLPQALRLVAVVENGEKTPDTEGLTERWRQHLPIHYLYVPEPNKSHALNQALHKFAQNDELVVFFDDDIRLDPLALTAYAEAAQGKTSGEYFGGRVDIDYENDRPPPEWLRPFLPACSLGWNLGDKRQNLTMPHILGCNWAAFNFDLKACGAFNTDKGPGAATGSIGQETDMQQRLIAQGVQPVYIPNARVWHFVESARCTPEWLLRYAYRHGIARGLAYEQECRCIRGVPFWLLARLMKDRVQLLATTLALKPQGRRFALKRRMAIARGMIKGIRLHHKSTAPKARETTA